MTTSVEKSNDTANATDSWCVTEFKTSSISFLWTIKHFSFCTEEKLKSSKFPAKRNTKSKWELELHSNGRNSDYKGYMSLYLYLVNSVEESVRAVFKISVINGEGDKIITKTVNEPHIFYKCNGFGFPMFLNRDDLFDESKELLHDDTLKLHCEITIIHQSNNISSDETKLEPDESPLNTSTSNFGELFNESLFTDVTLNVNGEQISAHKAILSARSPVFAAMFKHEMKENSQNEVIITDISYETMKDVLFFIYTGKTPSLDKKADMLFSAADKYGLDQLKLMCEDVLRSNLSVENAVNTLVLADMHTANSLKSYVIDFINNDIAAVKNTDILKASHLFMDLYSALAASKK